MSRFAARYTYNIFASFIRGIGSESSASVSTRSPLGVVLLTRYRGTIVAAARAHQRFTFVKKLLLHVGHTYTLWNNERSLRRAHGIYTLTRDIDLFRIIKGRKRV